MTSRHHSGNALALRGFRREPIFFGFVIAFYNVVDGSTISRPGGGFYARVA